MVVWLATRSQSPPAPELSTTVNKSGNVPLGISPSKVAEIRGQSFKQLSSLKRLFDDGVLTAAEFEDQKSSILCALKKLT